MLFLAVLNFLAAGFLGYLAGRIGDNYVNLWIGDPPWIPHHWIYGAILMAIGFLFFKNNLGLWVFSFGAGLLVSDLKDFMSLKFLEPDKKTKETRKFWHID